MDRKKGVVISLLLLLIVSISLVFSATSSPKCEEGIQTPCCGKSASGTEICYLFGNGSIQVTSEDKTYDISLGNIDNQGAEFIVNGESTGYLEFKEKSEAGGLAIQAGEVEYSSEFDSNLVIFDYNLTSSKDSSDLEQDKDPKETDFQEHYPYLDKKENALIELHPGWNLVPRVFSAEAHNKYFPDKTSSSCFNIIEESPPTFFYDPFNKKYDSKLDRKDSFINAREEGYIFATDLGSQWIYLDSDKSCEFMLEEDLLNYEKSVGKKLVKGWNFLSVTPSMVDKGTLGEVTKNCDVSSTYMWARGGESEGGSWYEIKFEGQEDKIYEESIGLGFIIKTNSECELNTGVSPSSDEGTAPSLPGE